ncbi:MAG: hypothetical protein HZC36_04860 [Armatimonadetes bacterium]|nr:hypothetical protein [Armatimonadota bacterium]
MSTSTSPSHEVPWTLRGALRPGLLAVRGHWQAFLLIQAAALGLVITYYHSASLQALADELARIKTRGGLPFAFVVGFLACSLIPEAAKLATGKLRRFDRAWLGKVAFTGLVYGIVAVQVDLFYQFLALWIGSGTDTRTFLLKTLVDMALFSTIISIPTAVLLFEWYKRGFAARALLAELSPTFYRDKVLPALLPCWAFWTPVLCCSYSMPVNLQFCFTMIAEAAWSLLFVFIATHEG